jgi:hypothetical protein
MEHVNYERALNKRAFMKVIKGTYPIVSVIAMCVIFAHHCELHDRLRCRTFFNKSKLFGGMKNPQY